MEACRITPNYRFHQTSEENLARTHAESQSIPSSFSSVLLPSSKPSLKEPDLLMVRVFSSSDMHEFLSRLSLQGSKGASWLVRLLLRMPARLIWAAEVGLDAAEMMHGMIEVKFFLLLICEWRCLDLWNVAVFSLKWEKTATSHF